MKPRPLFNGAATVEYNNIEKKDGQFVANFTVKLSKHTIRLLKLMKKGSARVRIKNMKRICKIFNRDWEEVKEDVRNEQR